jgi:putative MATE family efflux protein
MSQSVSANKASYIFTIIKNALKGEEQDYTTGSIRKAVFLLAVPMVLEMIMESVFVLVDLYFVGHLPDSSHAIQTVGLTESVLTIIYSLAIGISMAATALVARRIGEKNPEEAARAGMQAIIVAFLITLVISILGFIFADDILRMMGAKEDTIRYGVDYTRIMMGSSMVIMLLFLINGVFRGAGDAFMAMKSLWIANIANIILCPMLIRGYGPFPEMGLTGAAVATTIGRSLGVAYQLYHLFRGKGVIRIRARHMKVELPIISSVIKIASPGTLQFIIASCSWIFMAKIVADTGSKEASAGYQSALRVIMFFMLPAWGLAHAAATLVGQNLGAKQPERAEQSVTKTAKYNMVFLLTVTALFLGMGDYIVSFFTPDQAVQAYAVKAMWIISAGYVFYGVGMVMTSAFNGAGDTWTPTWINLFGFWALQVPLAYLLAVGMDMGPTGVFIAIPASETAITITAWILFKKGRWKKVKI